MGWPTTDFTQANYDWAKTANLAAFVAAITERLLAVNQATMLSTPVNGDAPLYQGTLAQMQLEITTAAPHFLDSTFSFAGIRVRTAGAAFVAGDGDTSWFARNRFHTGAYVAGQPNILKSAGCTAEPTGSTYQWTRKRPAEIANLATTTSYPDTLMQPTNTPAVNDVAYYLTDGKKYQLQVVAGTNTWVLLSAAAQLTSIVRTLSGWGQIIAGDYVGPWIWQEMYNALQLMTTTCTTGFWQIYGAQLDVRESDLYQYPNGGPPPDGGTAAGAQSAAATRFGTSANNYNLEAGGGGIIAPLPCATIGAWTRTVSNLYNVSLPPAWYACCLRTRGPIAMYAPLLAEAAPPFNRTLKYYAWTESDGLPISSGYANYDTLGDTVPAQDVTTLIHTDGPDSVNRAYSTTLYPSNSAAPSWGAGHAHDYASDGATDGIYLYSTIFIRCEWAMVYV